MFVDRVIQDLGRKINNLESSCACDDFVVPFDGLAGRNVISFEREKLTNACQEFGFRSQLENGREQLGVR